MLQKISTFWHFTNGKKIILLAVFIIWLFETIRFWLTRKERTLGKPANNIENKFDNAELVRDISSSIFLIAKFIKYKNVCRHQVYQAKVLCAWFKIPLLIYVGFKKNNHKIEGHAWATVNGHMIVGFCNPAEYTVQAIYTNL